MKIHHCHCGFRQHFQGKKLKSLGLGGLIFMFAHLLFHVAECLVLPTLIAFFSESLHHEATALTEGEGAAHGIVNETTVDASINLVAPQYVELTLPTGLTYYYPLKLPS